MSGLFEDIEMFDESHKVATRQAVAVANKRFNDQFGEFLRCASTEKEFYKRLALVDGDITNMVNDVAHEYEGDALKIKAALKQTLTEQAPKKNWPKPCKKCFDKGCDECGRTPAPEVERVSKERPERLKAQDEIQLAEEHSQVNPWLKKQIQDEDQEDGGNLRNKEAGEINSQPVANPVPLAEKPGIGGDVEKKLKDAPSAVGTGKASGSKGDHLLEDPDEDAEEENKDRGINSLLEEKYPESKDMNDMTKDQFFGQTPTGDLLKGMDEKDFIPHDKPSRRKKHETSVTIQSLFGAGPNPAEGPMGVNMTIPPEANADTSASLGGSGDGTGSGGASNDPNPVATSQSAGSSMTQDVMQQKMMASNRKHADDLIPESGPLIQDNPQSESGKSASNPIDSYQNFNDAAAAGLDTGAGSSAQNAVQAVGDLGSAVGDLATLHPVKAVGDVANAVGNAVEAVPVVGDIAHSIFGSTIGGIFASKPETGDSTEENESLPTGDESALDGPSPKMDKKKWKPNATNPDGNLKPIDTEGDKSPHPTRQMDIKQKPDYQNNDPWEHDNNVWEREQLPTADDNAGFDGTRNIDQPTKAAETFPDKGQTNPVTREALAAFQRVAIFEDERDILKKHVPEDYMPWPGFWNAMADARAAGIPDPQIEDLWLSAWRTDQEPEVLERIGITPWRSEYPETNEALAEEHARSNEEEEGEPEIEEIMEREDDDGDRVEIIHEEDEDDFEDDEDKPFDESEEPSDDDLEKLMREVEENPDDYA